jgi:hypothetical protein
MTFLTQSTPKTLLVRASDFLEKNQHAETGSYQLEKARNMLVGFYSEASALGEMQANLGDHVPSFSAIA